MRKNERGAALLIAIALSLVIAGLVAVYLMTVYFRQQQSTQIHAGRQASQLAEAGANAYVSALNQQTAQPPGVGETITWVQNQAYAGGTYTVTAINDGTLLTVTATGTYDGVVQSLTYLTTVGAGSTLPSSGDAGAINIFGFPGDALEIEVEDLQGAGVQGGAGNPALVIQDPDALANGSVQSFLAGLEDGEPAINKFDGGVTAPYDANGDGVFTDISIVNRENIVQDTEFFEDFRVAILDAVANEYVPNADQTFSAGTEAFPEELGGQGPPVTLDGITVIEGDVDLVGTVNGSGTLIVRGRLRIKDGGKLNFDGDIIVAGDPDKEGEAEFDIDADAGNGVGSLNLNLQGNLVVVGGDASGGEAEFEIDGGNVKIKGTVIAISGPGAETELEIDGGNVEIKGVLLAQGGEEVEVEFENDEAPGTGGGNLNLQGALFVGVSTPGGEVEIEIGDHLKIQFHAGFYDDAMDTLQVLVDSVMPVEELGGGKFLISQVYKRAAQ